MQIAPAESTNTERNEIDAVACKESMTAFRFDESHRVQKSDAGVGIGTLIGDRDHFAQK